MLYLFIVNHLLTTLNVGVIDMFTLRQFITFFQFITPLKCLLILSVIAPLLATNEDLETPERFAIPVAQVEPTPGQRTAQMQLEFLKKENFQDVLGADVVDSWGINWGQLTDPNLPFDSSIRIPALSQLYAKMNNLARRRTDEAFLKFFYQFLGVRQQSFVVHAERLESIALSYFQQLFPNATLRGDVKLDGVQLGERIIVDQAGSPPFTYHVKTHSEGRLSSKSTAAKPAGSHELLAYKILEHLGVGCETHFFERSPEDVYIATLDAGTGGSFTLFEVMSGHLGLGGSVDVGRHLCGSLIDNIHQDPSKLNHGAIEGGIQQDHVAQNFIGQFVTLDIITRVCKLHDLLNNPSNFGFSERGGQLPILRVIDFRVIDDPLYSGENYNPFGGFLVGNGLYRYAGSHKTMRYILHDRQLPLRVETARTLMEEGLAKRLESAVKSAYDDTLKYISKDVFAPHHEKFKLRVNEYYEAILHNISFFHTKLQEWPGE